MAEDLKLAKIIFQFGLKWFLIFFWRPRLTLPIPSVQWAATNESRLSWEPQGLTVKIVGQSPTRTAG